MSNVRSVQCSHVFSMMERRARELTRRYQRILDEIRQEDITAASIAYRTFTLSSHGSEAMMDIDLPGDSGLGITVDPPSSSPPTLAVTSEDLDHLLDLRMLRSSLKSRNDQQLSSALLPKNTPPSSSLTVVRPALHLCI